MKIINSSVIYENPLPQLRSRQAFFPFVAECKNGELVAVFAIGEAFESVDSASYISRSTDGGLTWSAPVAMFDKSAYKTPITDYCKAVALPDGRLLALGYGYIRENPDYPIGNPENGGVLDDFVFYSISEDNGKTWGKINEIPCIWGPHVEASAPITVLADGSWITPITGFPDWQGNMTGDMCGRALRSFDGGRSWSDKTVSMAFPSGNVTCYEQRMCQLESGTIVSIGWNEDVKSGERLMNHYTYSTDNGESFSSPESTGILGQASSVTAIGGERLLALHAVRRDTDCPGIYAYIVDFSEKKWNIVEEKLVWQPATPVVKDKNMAEIFSFLKFGQPGAVMLSCGDVMMTHWHCDNGAYKTVATRIKI